MSNNLFNNKYYNQLFGGRKQEQEQEDERTEDTRQRLERIFGGHKQEQEQEQEDERTEDTRLRLERIFGGHKQEQEQEQEEDERTEDTRQRLERIFGGARPKGSKNRTKEQIAAAKNAKLAGRVSDAEYMRLYGPAGTGKFTDKGEENGRKLFGFKNGAIAIRDDTGRFIIREGASKEKLDEIRALRAQAGELSHKVEKKHPGGLIKAAAAKKAFNAYWNRKTRQAKKYDSTHGTDTLKYVQRNKTYHTKYAHHSPKFHLDETSPKGYLYLRKERVLRQPDGSPSVYQSGKRKGELRVRRAGPAIYDFIGVAPEELKYSNKGKTKAPGWTKENPVYIENKWGQVEKLVDYRDEHPAMSEDEMEAHLEQRKQAHKNRVKATTAEEAIQFRDETIAVHRTNRGKSIDPVHSPHMAWAEHDPSVLPVSPVHKRRGV